MIRPVIVATGSYIPSTIVANEAFLSTRFFNKDGRVIEQDPALTMERFQAITGIAARRYALPEQHASDLGFHAAEAATLNGGLDPETLDYIIVAHNFGDVQAGSNRTDMVPSLATRIKARLGITNPDCVAYDVVFGCPGWVEGLIQASYYLRSGDARRCLVIGTETLSRVVDSADRDSMLFSDGAGAVVLEARTEGTAGILAHHSQTHAVDMAALLKMDRSFAPEPEMAADRYLKMEGRKLYEFALQQVPLVVRRALEKAEVPLTEIRKVFIHQANEKMDAAIMERLFKLYGLPKPDLDELMPMTISWLGNSSVATVPTLLDLLQRGELGQHTVAPGDKVVLASVGAGMNINAIVYQY
ncbi:3-oxoacyl-ACP synthase III family protein [Solirubrum puertoriconensis]|uniref:3-oxoacyl-ACP synthase n=1 Tax=Solirubrum puertoriconensis TaxID=1751427 RepID=A0A9X0L5Z3_SOLP1|nr:ketoacyl-ACP synthase III [Solirubrum puertoriconensis]KUG09126.1 3-oxoacyl-ACP synthase [Solirubrum puertoriconensis]